MGACVENQERGIGSQSGNGESGADDRDIDGNTRLAYWWPVQYKGAAHVGIDLQAVLCLGDEEGDIDGERGHGESRTADWNTDGDKCLDRWRPIQYESAAQIGIHLEVVGCVGDEEGDIVDDQWRGWEHR